MSGAARAVEGFSETDAGTITGTAPTTTQTYGTTNGTTGNSILYLSNPRVATEKVVATPSVSGTYSQAGTTVTVTTTTAHRLATGQSVTLDFTSGTAVDGTFTATVLSSTQFTVQRVGHDQRQRHGRRNGLATGPRHWHSGWRPSDDVPGGGTV